MIKEKQRIDFGKDSRNTWNATNPSQTFTYDDDGNMTQGYTPAPGNYNVSMTYDAENRLTSTEYTDSGAVVHRTEYFYSGNNFLAEIKKYEDASLVKTIRIVRAGFLPVQERDENNIITREYTWGLNMGGGIGGLLNLKQGGNDYLYLYDGKGNVMAVLNSTQSIVASYRYDEFGNLMDKTGTLDQPFMFSTKRYDQSTGTSYYGYRFYSPCTGRWITRDPIGEVGGINLYGFVGNDAVNWVDPWGENAAAMSPSDYFKCLSVQAKYSELITTLTNQREDKLAHCFLACEITKKYGPWTAHNCALAKEYVDKYDNDPTSHYETKDFDAGIDGIKFAVSECDDCLSECQKKW
jgi:RHS repeat-associated protein